MVIPLAYLPKLAQQHAREATKMIKKADAILGKDDKKSSSLLTAAAEKLELAAHYAREYEQEIFHRP